MRSSRLVASLARRRAFPTTTKHVLSKTQSYERTKSCSLVVQVQQPHQQHRCTTTTAAAAHSSSTNSTTTTNIVPQLQQHHAQQQQQGSTWYEFYLHCMQTRPLLTKATLAAAIFLCSDSTMQYIVHVNDGQDWNEFVWNAPRALSGGIFGVVATGWLHHWWGFLEIAVGNHISATRHRLVNTMTKVIIDQGFGAPLYIYTYYTLTNVSQYLLQAITATSTSTSTGSSQPIVVSQLWHYTQQVQGKAAEMLMPTMIQHWKLWPAVHSINFYYFSLHQRVVVQNCVLVLWSGYLSHLNHHHHHDREVTLVDGDGPRLATAISSIRDSGELMTPQREIQVAIQRHETALAAAAASAERQSSSSSTTITSYTTSESKQKEILSECEER